ncbi:hypothetical protein [Hafnia paralvei]|uniref:hypothetical protein n=1 Tax=Hafnia paralvei TaxID=546367 RepID=UPI0039AEC1F0
MNNLPIQTYESVVQQRDALAAENTAMKENIENVLSHWAAAEPGDMSWMMDKCMPSLRDSCIETPATDAFLHELMAKGVEEFSDNQMQKSLEQRAIGNPALSDIYNDNSMDAKVFASRLRKGINDAQ